MYSRTGTQYPGAGRSVRGRSNSAGPPSARDEGERDDGIRVHRIVRWDGLSDRRPGFHEHRHDRWGSALDAVGPGARRAGIGNGGCHDGAPDRAGRSGCELGAIRYPWQRCRAVQPASRNGISRLGPPARARRGERPTGPRRRHHGFGLACLRPPWHADRGQPGRGRVRRSARPGRRQLRSNLDQRPRRQTGGPGRRDRRQRLGPDPAARRRESGPAVWDLRLSGRCDGDGRREFAADPHRRGSGHGGRSVGRLLDRADVRHRVGRQPRCRRRPR